MNLHYLKIRDVIETPDQDYKLLLGQFLDDFSYTDDKASLIAEEPGRLQNAAPSYWPAMLAAISEVLATANNLPVPPWVFENTYYLDKPTYALNTQNDAFRNYLMQTTPPEFSKRNLYLGNSVLERC